VGKRAWWPAGDHRDFCKFGGGQTALEQEEKK
jgi:hypothetical protein